MLQCRVSSRVTLKYKQRGRDERRPASIPRLLSSRHSSPYSVAVLECSLPFTPVHLPLSSFSFHLEVLIRVDDAHRRTSRRHLPIHRHFSSVKQREFYRGLVSHRHAPVACRLTMLFQNLLPHGLLPELRTTDSLFEDELRMRPGRHLYPAS